MEQQASIDMMKDGARRMQEFLAGENIEVKHSMLLEAISAGFGSRNWRTVREKLNAPVAPPALTLESLDGLQWEVHALYCDNDQPYTDFYEGRCAMEAAVRCQVACMLDQEGGEVAICSVIDRLTRKTVDHFGLSGPSNLKPHAHSVLLVALEAERWLAGDAEESTNLPGLNFTLCDAITIVKMLCEPGDEADALNAISPFDVDEPGFYADQSCDFLLEEEHTPVTIEPCDAIQAIVDFVSEPILTRGNDTDKNALFHTTALLEYAKLEVNYALAN